MYIFEMQNFPDTFETRKRISAFSICTTVPLKGFKGKIL